jgi:transcriptional regulator with XRE-family HTH domain
MRLLKRAVLEEICMIREPLAQRPVASFAELLRQLRNSARLTQEELAYAAGLSPRSISDLERGISRTARKATADRLADVLAMTGAERTAFVAVARGRAPTPAALSAEGARISELPAIPVLQCFHDAPGLSLRQATLGSLIDAIAAAAFGRGGPGTEMWLIGLTAPALDDETPPAAETPG